MSKWSGLLMVAFLGFMIAVSIFFSSSPFAIASDYSCQNGYCAMSGASFSVFSNYIDSINKTDNRIKTSSLSTIGNTATCKYYSNTFCLGDIVRTDDFIGQRYLVKQSSNYDGTTAQCDAPLNYTYYYVDCNAIHKVCSAGRCVSNSIEHNFFTIMEGIGFRP